MSYEQRLQADTPVVLWSNQVHAVQEHNQSIVELARTVAELNREAGRFASRQDRRDGEFTVP